MAAEPEERGVEQAASAVRRPGDRWAAGHAAAPSREHPGSRRYDEAPVVVTWEVTQACDLKCAHCRGDARPQRDPRELTFREGAALLERISAFGAPGPVVVFTGGDPLKRPDLFALVEHAVSLGLPAAVIPAPTPGVDRAVIQRLTKAGARRLALSLDGAIASRHDAFRGEAGSFEAALRAAGHAAALRLPLQINTTVTATTASDLPAIADLVEELHAVAWEVFFLVRIGRGRALEGLSPLETEQVLGWLYRRQREAPFRVLTVEAPQYRRVADQIERQETGTSVRVGSTGDGNGFLFIGHTGEVCPSGFLPVSAGNVRTDDPVDLYRNAPLFRQLRDRSLLKGKCGVCEYRHFCGGSRAQAYAVTGDPFEADPFCPYLPERYRRMVERGEAPPPEGRERQPAGRSAPPV